MSKRPRWVPFVPLVLAAGGLVVLLRVLPGADAGPPRSVGGLSPCSERPAVGRALAARPGAWWKLRPNLDSRGAVVGQRLQVGTAGVPVGATDLGAESTASGPVNGVVLVADDDGTRSALRLVATQAGCSVSIFATSDVIRSAILDPADGAVIYHSVDRSSRADRGTWRIETGATAPVLVLDALPSGALATPVFGTALALDEAGSRLAVQSCTEGRCLTRLVDAWAGGPSSTLADPLQGPMLGLTSDGLATWAACGLPPCDVVVWPLAGGRAATLVHAASAAALSSDGRHLVAVVDPATGVALDVDPATGASRRLAGLHPGEQPLAPPFAEAGLEVPPDAVPVEAVNAEPRAFRPADQEVQP